jgi:uncharacterized damage-inducible protein DinB
MSKPNKSAFLKQYALDRAGLHAFINSLTESQLSQPADAAGWTIKDHLAHLAAWQIGIAQLLQHKPRWEAMGLKLAYVRKVKNFDVINALMQRRHSKLSIREVLDFLSTADAQFLFALSKLSSADLNKPYAFYSGEEPSQRTSEPVFGWVEGDSGHHFNEHLIWMRQILVDDRTRKIELYGQGCDLLDAALKKIPRKIWQFKPTKRNWSIHEVLVHLADSETNSYLRCRKAVAEPGEAIMAYDQDKWADALGYHERDVEDARATVRLVRKLTYSFIKALPDAEWDKSYYHPESKRQVKLSEWIGSYAVHIPDHIEQIQRNHAVWKKRNG